MSEDTLQLLERNRRLEILLEVGAAIGHVLSLDRLLLLIAEKSAEALDAERSTLFLVDHDRRELWSKVALGAPEIRFSMDQGLAGHTARTGEVLVIPDAYKDPRFNPDIDRKTGYRTRDMLVMPMRNKAGVIIGVFQVLNKRAGTFGESDVELLDAISGSAAVSIENAQLYQELKETFESLIETLAATIDARHPLTAGHSARVAEYTVGIAREMDMPEDELEMLRIAGLLHDFGKIAIPDSILMKTGRLDDAEFTVMKTHVARTDDILRKIKFSREYRDIPHVAASHHERMDGSGYHLKLADGDIPLGGRIMAIADVFDALTSKRDYRDGMRYSEVIKIIEKEVGGHFDPEVYAAFKRYFEKELLPNEAERSRKAHL